MATRELDRAASQLMSFSEAAEYVGRSRKWLSDQAERGRVPYVKPALARTGLPAFALQAHAGHASITTTQGYVNRQEVAAAGYAEQLERAAFGTAGTNEGYKAASDAAEADASVG